MLSIDEAIAHAREVANEQKRRSGICVQNNSECDKFSACLKCAEEHEQLAEWLEELKTYREKKCNKSVYLANKSIDMIDAVNKGYTDGYNKAIDDAKSVILQTLDNEILVDTLHLRLEQLKERTEK